MQWEVNVLFFFSIQYPLKEVVAISGDANTLRDVQALESYITEVRQAGK